MNAHTWPTSLVSFMVQTVTLTSISVDCFNINRTEKRKYHNDVTGGV